MVLHTSHGGRESPGRHDTTICSLRSTRTWQELQAPAEVAAQHSYLELSPWDGGSGGKALVGHFTSPYLCAVPIYMHLIFDSRVGSRCTFHM